MRAFIIRCVHPISTREIILSEACVHGAFVAHFLSWVREKSGRAANKSDPVRQTKCNAVSFLQFEAEPRKKWFCSVHNIHKV